MHIFLVFLLLLIPYESNAMQRDVSLNYMVSQADIIAIADIIDAKNVGTLDSKIKVFANLVKVDSPLKGNIAVGEKLKIKTTSFEDDASLYVGKKYILFLKKEKNYYRVAFGCLGNWPIDEKGKISGYGRGKTLKDVENAIENLKNAPVNKEKSKSTTITI